MLPVAAICRSISATGARSRFRPRNLPRLHCQRANYSLFSCTGEADSVDIVASSITDATMTSAPYADCFYSWWTPPGSLQLFMNWLHSHHDLFGYSIDLPWWGAITASVVTLRLCTSIVYVATQKDFDKLRIHLPEYNRLQQEAVLLRRSSDNVDDWIRSEYLRKKAADLMKKNNVSLWPTLIKMPAINGFLLMSYFFALRSFALKPMEGFTTEGLLWFSDLSIPDPFFVLPLYSGLTVAYILWVGAETGGQQTLPLQTIRFMAVASAIAIIAVSASYPSALGFYWAISNTYSLLQFSIFRTNVVRKYFGLTPLSGARSSPKSPPASATGR